MLEREVKLSFPSLDEARAAVAAAGASLLLPRRLQRDALFDTPDRSLRARGCVLRLRDEGTRTFLTFKGPVQPGAVKLREEHETVVADGAAIVRVLEGAGLRPWFRYEKYREEYSWPGATIAIDDTPVGVYVEIEGQEDAIHAAAAALGRSHTDFILDSYRALFLAHRRTLGLADGDMLFAAAGRLER